jgi:outer membrane immunogenic protein
MVKLLGGLVAFATMLTSTLYAADTPVKVPHPEAVWNWTGFYIGAHGGYGWSRDNFFDAEGILSFPPIDGRGYLIGGHAGYNWQRGKLVGGLEVDLSVPRIGGDSIVSAIIPGPGGPFGGDAFVRNSRSFSYDYLGTARGRIGFSPQG